MGARRVRHTGDQRRPHELEVLPDIELDPRLVATTDLPTVVKGCDVVFVALPSVFIKPSLADVRGQMAEDCLIVNMAKGIDRQTGLTSFQTIGSMFPRNRRVILSGPSIANEFARRMPTVVVIAGEHTDELLAVSNIPGQRPLPHALLGRSDRRGAGWHPKNIYALGLGLFDGGTAGRDQRPLRRRGVHPVLIKELVEYDSG